MEIQQASNLPRMEVGHDNDQLEHSHSKRSRKMIGKYYLYKTVGRGSTGKVKLAVNTTTNEKVAVKLVARKLISNTTQPILTTADAIAKQKKEKAAMVSREIRTLREASIMLLLNHPNIACVNELIVTEECYYLCMEYVDGGQLLDYIISHGKLKEKQARQFSRQIVSALDYCHRNSIVHRDLKVENILISRKGIVKIIDFGLSNVFSPTSLLKTFCGSLYFAAPELLDGQLYTGPEVDVWSFGVVLYVLVCGQVPFDDPTVSGMHAKVKKGYVEYPSHLSSDCKHLLQHLLVTNSKTRATMSEIIVHPWMNKGYDRPIENHLPNRKPLQMPIDMKVVNGMNGFEFGSVEQITKKLESLVSSYEYQSAAKNLEISSQRTASINSSLNPNFYHPSNILRRKSFTYAMDDPQCIPAAYHPLISIYYLVKERMERESSFALNVFDSESKNNDSSINNVTASHTTSTNTSPSENLTHSIGYSYTADGKCEVHNPTENEEAVIRKSMHFDESAVKSSSNSCHTQKTPDTLSISPKDTMFRRLSRRLSRQFEDYNFPTYDKGSPATQPSGEVSPIIAVNGSLEPTVNNYNDYASPSIDAQSVCNAKTNTNTENKLNRFMKRATSITVKDFPSTQKEKGTFENEKPRRRSVFHYAVTNKKKAECKSTTQNDGFLAPPPPTLAPNGSGRNRRNSSVSTTSNTKSFDHADESVRPVYLKGLFSVSNTSTKKASAIRNEIVRVLDKKPDIHYKETKDRFECYITKSTIHQSNFGHDFFDYSSEGNVWNNNNPDAVRFDICIVKIPWLLSVRGIQFRRISGDPWYYRDTCSRILKSLHL